MPSDSKRQAKNRRVRYCQVNLLMQSRAPQLRDGLKKVSVMRDRFPSLPPPLAGSWPPCLGKNKTATNKADSFLQLNLNAVYRDLDKQRRNQCER